MKDGKWWDYSWNVAPGCTKIGPECLNCWALTMAKRLRGMKKYGYSGLVDDRGQWTGRINLQEERLGVPLRLKKPRWIAVNLMGDLFHQDMPDWFQASVFRVMERANWHTYMVLTKRIEICAEFLRKVAPMAHVLIGTTAGTQRSANERWNAMAWIAQAGWNTWVSSEPRLEGIDWHGWEFLKWMVTGGESGPQARPMAPSWARGDRDWCRDHGVAFWFKQWGEWGPNAKDEGGKMKDESQYLGHVFRRPLLWDEMVFQFGRRLAGRVLDGKIHEERP